MDLFISIVLGTVIWPGYEQ